ASNKPRDDRGDQDWADQDGDELFSAAYENMIYRDSTDDGREGDMLEERGASIGSDLELEEESQRLGRRLSFLTTIARLWKHAAVCWDVFSPDARERCELFENWQQEATSRYAGLIGLIEAVHNYRIRSSSGSHDSNVE